MVVTEHNTLSQETRHERRLVGRLWPHLLRTFYPWATTVVAVSRGAADDLARTSGLPRDRVEVVYNPVITPTMMALARQAPDHPWFAPGQPPVILGVGRLTRQKDFSTLVLAFAEVRRRRTARLVILGEGEDRPALEAMVHELGLAQDVALPGFPGQRRRLHGGLGSVRALLCLGGTAHGSDRGARGGSPGGLHGLSQRPERSSRRAGSARWCRWEMPPRWPRPFSRPWSGHGALSRLTRSLHSPAMPRSTTTSE